MKAAFSATTSAFLLNFRFDPSFYITYIVDIFSKVADIAVTIGVLIAMLELLSKWRRERRVDSSSISITPKTRDGSFIISNNGSVSIYLELYSGIYVDGKIEKDSQKIFELHADKKRNEIRNLSFKLLLSVPLNAKENLVFYPFDINGYEVFVFAGSLKVIINRKFKRHYLATFTGKRVDHSETLRIKSHPQFTWVIRDIF